MGIGDRDYMGGRGGGPFGAVSGMSPVTMIIVINIVVFFLWQSVDTRFMREHFMVSLVHLQSGHVWTLLTAAFSHQSFNHLLMNMLGLFFIGRALLQRWGPKKFVTVYLGLALFANAMHPLSALLGFGIPEQMALGASGAVVGSLVALALYYPRMTVLFMFLIPVKLGYLAAFVVLSDLYGFIEKPMAGIGYGVHLGGALGAFLYVKWLEPKLGSSEFSMPRPRRERRPRGRVIRPDESTWQQRPAPPRAADPDERLMDLLLEKVHKGGLDSLTPDERDTLERISQKRRSSRR